MCLAKLTDKGNLLVLTCDFLTFKILAKKKGNFIFFFFS